MKRIQLKFICLTILLTTINCYAQESEDSISNATVYEAKAFGSAASGDNTPFWMASNQYGVVPLNANNGYLSAGVYHHQEFGKSFRWGAGLNAIAAIPRHRNVFIQQIYAEIGYKCLLLSLGSKEQYTSLVDSRLSTGDVLLSTNARPIPEINLSIPRFTVIPGMKGWLQVKGDFAVGRSFDTDYLKDFVKEGQVYIQNVLWHHKSGYLRLQDTRNHFPLWATLGIEHVAQWGGTSTRPDIGKQPHSLKDFLRIVTGQKGGGDATVSDQINVLGNHHIAYVFELGFAKNNWALRGYYQHLSADKSGLEFYNGADGLWGVQLDLPRFPWISKLVVEYFATTNQSGPFHYITFDHDKHPGRGGGADNYYNNGEYVTGHSYFNRGIGSALIPAPEYNTDGGLGFKNNRIKDWHIGMEGSLSSQLSYRLLFTWMNGWGTAYAPFLKKREGTSFLADVTYIHPRLAGWSFTGTFAGDTGDMIGKSIGASLTVSKRGILKAW